MKKMILLLLLLIFISSPGFAQFQPAQRTENHQYLDRMVGNWSVEVVSFNTPFSRPGSSTGSATIDWTLDKLWLRENYQGKVMNTFVFKESSFLTYDASAAVFRLIAIDNLTAFAREYTGSFTAENQLELVANYTIMGMNIFDKFKWNFTSKDSFTLQIEKSQDQKNWHLCSELHYTRLK